MTLGIVMIADGNNLDAFDGTDIRTASVRIGEIIIPVISIILFKKMLG
ncbi:MAG: hypothetical protein ABI999_17445 [Acidobacteriota bacterium]